jgi:hypothetical protein
MRAKRFESFVCQVARPAERQIRSTPCGHIHRLRGELDPGKAVAEANAEVVRIVLNENRLPIFDLIF